MSGRWLVTIESRPLVTSQKTLREKKAHVSLFSLSERENHSRDLGVTLISRFLLNTEFALFAVMGTPNTPKRRKINSWESLLSNIPMEERGGVDLVKVLIEMEEPSVFVTNKRAFQKLSLEHFFGDESDLIDRVLESTSTDKVCHKHFECFLTNLPLFAWHIPIFFLFTTHTLHPSSQL